MTDLFGERDEITTIDDFVYEPGVYDVLCAYNAAYRRHLHVAAPIVRGKDGAIAARLLKRYDFDDLYNWLALFFIVKDSFIQQSGYTLAVFERCIGKVIVHAKRIRAANIERQPVTEAQMAHARAVRAEMDEQDAQDAIDRADAYYRERPWLPR